MKTPRAVLALSVICLISSCLRIPGLFTDFWGDEIWSWSIAGQLHSVIDVLLAAQAHIDNNHPLNTLWLYWVGQQAPIWLYRLPALLAGIASVVVAARLMWKRGPIEAIIAAVLFACSYPLVFYSSEARGYSFEILFGLTAFGFLRSALAAEAREKPSTDIFFGLASILGFLSHLTFLHVYVAAAFWSMVRVRQLEPTTRLRVLRLVRLHAIPLCFALLLFRFFIRDMVIGGAAPTSPRGVFLQTLSLTAGGPEVGFLAMLAAIAVSLLFVGGLIYLAGEKTGEWIFFLVAVVVSPALVCTRDLFFSERPQPLMLRYFLICIAMLLLSVTPLLANLWRRGSTHRACSVAMIVAFALGNLWNVDLFLRTGRGHYAQALARVVAETSGPLTISSDNPLRTGMLIEFYGPRVGAGRQITISTGPHPWLILNRTTPQAPAALLYDDVPYTLLDVYGAGTLSGWNWDVYRMR